MLLLFEAFSLMFGVLYWRMGSRCSFLFLASHFLFLVACCWILLTFYSQFAVRCSIYLILPVGIWNWLLAVHFNFSFKYYVNCCRCSPQATSISLPAISFTSHAARLWQDMLCVYLLSRVMFLRVWVQGLSTPHWGSLRIPVTLLSCDLYWVE